MRASGLDELLEAGRITFVADWRAPWWFEVAYIPGVGATTDEQRADLAIVGQWRDALALLQGPWPYGSGRDALFNDMHEAQRAGTSYPKLAAQLNAWCEQQERESDVAELLAFFRWTEPIEAICEHVRDGYPPFDDGKVREALRRWRARWGLTS